MVFLGEYPHECPDIQSAIADTAVSLAQRKQLRTLAAESVYALYPKLENDSGKGLPVNLVGQAINTFNSTAAEAERIIVTSIEIEHSVRHSRHQTARFFRYLSSRSSVPVVQDEMAGIASSLADLTDGKEIYDAAGRFESVFEMNTRSFDEDAIREIRFAVNLTRSSLAFDMPEHRGPNESFTTDELAMFSSRAHWFRETIRNARQRLRHCGRGMICWVGMHHAALKPVVSWEPGNPTWPEAYYFNMVNRGTVGSVCSIMVRALTYGSFEQPLFSDDDPIDGSVQSWIGSESVGFLRLPERAEVPADWRDSQYYVNGEPLFAGIVFLKEVP